MSNQWLRQIIIYFPPLNKNILDYKNYFLSLEKCKTIRLWMCVRHGTRYPSQDILNNISKHTITIQDSLRKLYNDKSHNNYKGLKNNERTVIDYLTKWDNVLENASHKDLNIRGFKTMVLLGKKIKAKFQPFSTQINSSEVEVNISNVICCMILNLIIYTDFGSGRR